MERSVAERGECFTPARSKEQGHNHNSDKLQHLQRTVMLTNLVTGLPNNSQQYICAVLHPDYRGWSKGSSLD